MLSKKSETGAKKSGAKPAKSKKITLASQTIGTKKRHDRHEMIANVAYFRAEKRAFKSSSTDAVQDWLEAEVEIDNV